MYNCPVKKIECKYCSRCVSIYYIPYHQQTKRCSKLQEKMKHHYKALNDILNNNVEHYEIKKCIFCKKKVLKQAKCSKDEIDIDYSKLHKKCLYEAIEISNKKFELNDIKICHNSSISF